MKTKHEEGVRSKTRTQEKYEKEAEIYIDLNGLEVKNLILNALQEQEEEFEQQFKNKINEIVLNHKKTIAGLCNDIKKEALAEQKAKFEEVLENMIYQIDSCVISPLEGYTEGNDITRGRTMEIIRDYFNKCSNRLRIEFKEALNQKGDKRDE